MPLSPRQIHLLQNGQFGVVFVAAVKQRTSVRAAAAAAAMEVTFLSTSHPKARLLTIVMRAVHILLKDEAGWECQKMSRETTFCHFPCLDNACHVKETADCFFGQKDCCSSYTQSWCEVGERERWSIQFSPNNSPPHATIRTTAAMKTNFVTRTSTRPCRVSAFIFV